MRGEKREADIRGMSESYGRTWCWNNMKRAKTDIFNALLGVAPVGDPLKVRVYDRANNAMREACFLDVVKEVRDLKGEGILPMHHPNPTRFGQVALTSSMYVSTNIFDFIVLTLQEAQANADPITADEDV